MKVPALLEPKRDPKTGKNGSNANGSGGDKKGSGNTLDEMNGAKSKPDNSTPYSKSTR